VRKEVFLFLPLIVCLFANLSCTTSASTADTAQAGSSPSASVQQISGVLVTQKLTTEPGANAQITHPQGDLKVVSAQDKDNRQKASVVTAVSAPSKTPPAPPQRLRIVVIKD
jgi:hypothetical protein